MNLIAVEIELFQNKKIYSLYPTFNKWMSNLTLFTDLVITLPLYTAALFVSDLSLVLWPWPFDLSYFYKSIWTFHPGIAYTALVTFFSVTAINTQQITADQMWPWPPHRSCVKVIDQSLWPYKG